MRRRKAGGKKQGEYSRKSSRSAYSREKAGNAADITALLLENCRKIAEKQAEKFADIGYNCKFS